MRFTCITLCTCLLLIGKNATCQVKVRKDSKKPNIIFILTDDLGYGDIGVLYQNKRKEINDESEPWTVTPSLDKMAAEGAILTQHYAAAPVCAPSRASLLSGLNQGHANVRNNQFDKALADNYTLANVLKKVGYTTAAIGKWGLQGDKRWDEHGEKWPAAPLKRGFDYFYGYMKHRDGHEHYPKEGLYDGPKEVWENNNEVSKDLDKCYTADLWTAAAKRWIIKHEEENDPRPFFMYLAYDTPHAVLELPTKPYPEGGGLNGGLQWLGKPHHMINTASGKPDTWIHPEYSNAVYDQDNDNSTPNIPWPETYKRYATSTRRIDDAVGDILKLLEDLHIDSNTLVVFSSDNGPSKESYLPKDFVPYTPDFFNSFGPFDGIKRDVLEGGERMPLIAWWPGHIPNGRVNDTPSISYDWLPTFLEAAGLPAPVNSDGVSLLPALTGKGSQEEAQVYVEYFHGGKTPAYKEFLPAHRNKRRKQMQLIRIGNMVGIRYNINSADDDFEIYDIIKDPQQKNNLAAHGSLKELQERMKERVLQVRIPDSSANRPYDNEPVPSESIEPSQKGIQWKAFNGNFQWLPNTSNLKVVDQGKMSGFNVTDLEKKPHDYYLFQGYVMVPEDGEYNFYLSTNSKAFLKIHDAHLIDADFDYEPGTQKKGTIRLKKGFHPVQLYYQNERNSKNFLELKWAGPSGKKENLSNSFYYPE